MFGRLCLVSTILLSAIVAGCIGAEEDPAPEEPAPTIEAVAGKGTVKGQVVSAEDLEYIRDAQVNLVRSDAANAAVHEAKTNAKGEYVINEVEPGRYSVIVFAIGFNQGAKAVDVRADTVHDLSFQLEILRGDGPYDTWQSFSGYIDEAVSWQLEGPVGCVIIPSPVLLDVKNCGGIRFGGENGEIGVDGELNITEDVKTILVEMVWSPVGPLGEHLQIDLMCPEVPRGNGGAVLDTGHPCYFDTPGRESPLVHRVDEQHWIDGAYNFTGEWRARIFATYGTLGTYDLTKIDAGVAYQQAFTVYVSIFHGEPAPEGHTGIPDA